MAIWNSAKEFAIIAFIVGFALIMSAISPTETQAKAQLERSEFVISDSHTREIREDELRNLSNRQLWQARNEIVARRGFIFATQTANSFFSRFQYYRPTTTQVELSDVEKGNMRTIARVEELRRTATAPPSRAVPDSSNRRLDADQGASRSSPITRSEREVPSDGISQAQIQQRERDAEMHRENERRRIEWEVQQAQSRNIQDHNRLFRESAEYKLQTLYVLYLSYRACFEGRSDRLLTDISQENMNQTREQVRKAEETILGTARLNRDDVWNRVGIEFNFDRRLNEVKSGVLDLPQEGTDFWLGQEFETDPAGRIQRARVMPVGCSRVRSRMGTFLGQFIRANEAPRRDF